MTAQEILPWVSLALNSLLLPAMASLQTIKSELAKLEERTGGHGKRLDNLERSKA